MEAHLIKFRVELVQADIFMLLGANSLDKAEEIMKIGLQPSVKFPTILGNEVTIPLKRSDDDVM